MQALKAATDREVFIEREFEIGVKSVGFGGRTIHEFDAGDPVLGYLNIRVVVVKCREIQPESRSSTMLFRPSSYVVQSLWSEGWGSGRE